ncbi:hypothetical protein [Oerskovia flava]|uniref:hypothetical protein n=1 Tax=Oerskovia flava TaxID=2986422 RepID=UPI00223F9CB2|nr:hypothetical protein [Oerskovia sp. JB1-3-2]
MTFLRRSADRTTLVLPAPRTAVASTLLLALLVASALTLVWGSVTAAPAAAAARVIVTNDRGTAQADTAYATTVSVSGSGFQSVTGAFGGIYVFFGWVSDPSGGSWAPSRGGTVGADYRYVPDSEHADNQGFQRFVAFPGSETGYAANGGEIAADGTWSTRLVIPGPTFQALDRAGKATTVDCREVQCGVITFGAHGVRNATNETFTPVEFVDLAGAGSAAGAGGDGSSADAGEQRASGAGEGSAAGGAAGEGTGGADGADGDGADATDEEAVDEEPGTATLGVDQATAVVGHAMSFVGQGFEPGEQVVGVVDNGIVAVGPLNAGTHGEVAGIIQLPADLRTGTHVLRLTGATSGLTPEVEFTATRDPAQVAALEEASTQEPAAGYSAAEIAVAVAGLVLLLVVLSSFAAARRRRRAAASAGPAESVGPAAADPADTSDALPDVLPDRPTDVTPGATAPLPAFAPTAGRHA